MQYQYTIIAPGFLTQLGRERHVSQSVSLPTDANPAYIMYSGGIGYVVVVLVVVAAVVFDVILTHSYDAVRGHRAGSNNFLFSVPCLPSPTFFSPS